MYIEVGPIGSGFRAVIDVYVDSLLGVLAASVGCASGDGKTCVNVTGLSTFADFDVRVSTNGTGSPGPFKLLWKGTRNVPLCVSVCLFV